METTKPLFEGAFRAHPSRQARAFQKRFAKTLAPIVRSLRMEGSADAEIYLTIFFLATQILNDEIGAFTQSTAPRPIHQVATDSKPINNLSRALVLLLRPMIRFGHPYPDLLSLTVLATTSAMESSHEAIQMMNGLN